jgi:hypothetical protein
MRDGREGIPKCKFNYLETITKLLTSHIKPLFPILLYSHHAFMYQFPYNTDMYSATMCPVSIRRSTTPHCIIVK